MTDVTSVGRDGKPPRVLLLYYSYSGQSRKVLDAFAEVFGARGYEVSFAAIEFTDAEYSAPFSRFPLERVWPDMLSVLKAQSRGETGGIGIPEAVTDGEYDLICIGSPTWWKTVSMPMRTFLKSDEARKLLSGKPRCAVSIGWKTSPQCASWPRSGVAGSSTRSTSPIPATRCVR